MAEPTPTDPLERLIEALHAQTAAMNELAQSNRELVDLIAADADVDTDEQLERLLDGSLED